MRTSVELSCQELLSTTRSVRRALDLTRDVDLETVRYCLRLALQAPNGSNGQRWRWIVLTDPVRRAEVASVYRTAFYERNAPALDRLDQASAADRRMLSGARDLADKLHLVPVLVIPCLQLGSTRLPVGNQASIWGSLLPAAWSYVLAARTCGLAACWTTAHLDREQEVARLLGLPPQVRQGALLPTAHSRITTFRPGARRPLEDVLHIDGWDAAREAAARTGGRG